MTKKNKNLDDIISRAADSNAAESIRELSSDEMSEVTGGELAAKKATLPGSGSRSWGCQNGTFCVSTNHTDGVATDNGCCKKRTR